MHNVGSMFRTADGAGISKLFLCGITPGPLDRWGNENAKFLKVSLGSEKSVAWERMESTMETLVRLKKDGHTILALEIHEKAVSVFEYEVSTEKYAVVLGGEVSGLSPEILEMADAILEIPMRGEKESLNVSVAFGVAIFSLTQ